MTPPASFVVVQILWVAPTLTLWVLCFPFNLAWLFQACFRVSGVFKETPPWLCVHAGISTRQKTHHNVQPTTDIRTGWGCLAAYHFNSFLVDSLLSCHSPLYSCWGSCLLIALVLPFLPYCPSQRHKAATTHQLFLPAAPFLGVFSWVWLVLHLLHILQKPLSRCWLAENL